MTNPADKVFDRAMLDRIVAATGLALSSDYKSLQIELRQCYRVWWLLSDFTRSPANKGIKRLTKLHGWAVQGAKLLSDDEDDKAYIRQLWATHGGGYRPLLPQIKRLEALLKKVQRGKVEYRGSPLENLTGVLLPSVFRFHFGRPAKLRRDPITNKVGGPYICFAKQVCIEFGIKCSPETIASAMRRHRAKPGEK